MATGDAAVAAGMRRVLGTELANTMETIEMETRDYIAAYAARSGSLIDIWVQTAAPAHKIGRVWIKST